MLSSNDDEVTLPVSPANSAATLDSLDMGALIYRLRQGTPLLVGANRSARRLFGLTDGSLEETWQWLDARTQPLATDAHPAHATIHGGDDWQTFYLRQADQPLRGARLRVSRLEAPDNDGDDTLRLVAVSEVIAIDHAEPRLPSSLPHLRQFLGSLTMGACIVDIDGYLRFVNPAFCDFFGYAETDLLDAHFRQLLPPEARQHEESLHAERFYGGVSQRRAVEVLLADGSRCTVIAEGALSRDENDQLQRVAFIVDISHHLDTERELEAQNRRLEYLANRDDLTGLHNRRVGMQLLEKAIGRSREREEPLSVAMLDLDHFKAVNDRHGHAAGDAVLADFGQLTQRSLRGGDTLIRLGGEEFLVILPGVDRLAAQRAMQRLLETIGEHVFSDAELRMTFSAGVSDHHGQPMATLLAEVDRALYQAKDAGRACVVLAPLPASKTTETTPSHSSSSRSLL